MSLRNGNFEADWSEESSHRCKVFPVGGSPFEQEIGNIFNPPGWMVWFRHEEGNWSQPECRDARAKNPDRMHSGEKGYLIFTFGRKQDAGLMQQVSVEPGQHLRFSVWNHAWSNHKDTSLPEKFPHPDDPFWSEGAGKGAYFALEGTVDDDATRNFTFWVGIDPTGGTNPFADTVVWGPGAHIYNVYHETPVVEVIAESDTVTVFTRSRAIWPFKHNDSYTDDAKLEVIDEPAPPPISSRGQPREQYERLSVLLPPNADPALVRLVTNAAIEYHASVIWSADDGGVGDLDKRVVVAVNPDAWGDDLQAFFEQFYPGVKYYPVTGENDFQLAGGILAAILRARGVSLRYPTTHMPPYITSEFGVWRPDGDPNPYHHGGLDLASSYAAYGDMILVAYGGEVVKSGFYQPQHYFGYQVEIKSILLDGRVMHIRYAHLVKDSQTVSVGDIVGEGYPLGKAGATGNTTGAHAHISVNVDGQKYDPTGLIRWPDDDAPTDDPSAPDPLPPAPSPGDTIHNVQIGMHDDSGGDWMAERGLTGYVLAHRPIERKPYPVDMRHLADAGIKVIMRWGWGYADGGGTVPPQADERAWIDAMVSTVMQSQGVWLNTFNNEVNNPAEWTGGHPNPTEILTPQRVVDLYNAVVSRLPSDILVAPGALDWYNVVAQEFGQPGDPKDWFEIIHTGVLRVDAVLVHAKTQTNNPAECSSEEKFSDPPLTGRYFNLRTYRDQLNAIKPGMRYLPVIITELNPQTVAGMMNGWASNDGPWVTAAMNELRQWNAVSDQPIAGVCFYRYDMADPWGLADKSKVLDEIEKQGRL